MGDPYLVQAGLLERPKRAVVTITQRGRDVLEANPERVDNTVLESFPEFREFKNRSGTRPRPGRGVNASAAEGAGSNARLILIDGEPLGNLVVTYNVGVQDDETFVLKEIDEDYFEEYCSKHGQLATEQHPDGPSAGPAEPTAMATSGNRTHSMYSQMGGSCRADAIVGRQRASQRPLTSPSAGTRAGASAR